MTKPLPKPPRVDKLARRVAKTSAKAIGKRRTQAERRAATRGALLEAALASLVEDGYANMTTRNVAERAGVSQGTQQHYFASKQDFVVEAMRYALQRIAADALDRIDLPGFLDPDRQEELLDEVWRVHRSQAFKAALELWIAARTDTDLRRSMRKLEREVTAMIGGAARELHPDADRDPVAMELLDLSLATIRGYAMLAPVVPQAELERRWSKARGHLARRLREHLEGQGVEEL